MAGSDIEVLVDPADADWAMGYCWYLGRDGYVYRNLSHRTEGKGHVAMHRELLGLVKGDGVQADHRNLVKHDNRRANLRRATEVQNKQNQPLRGGGSRHRGVSRYRPRGRDFPNCRWRARVQTGGKVKVGYFATEEEAAAAAEQWRRELLPYATN